MIFQKMVFRCLFNISTSKNPQRNQDTSEDLAHCTFFFLIGSSSWIRVPFCSKKGFSNNFWIEKRSVKTSKILSSLDLRERLL